MFKRICTAALVFGTLAVAPPLPSPAQVACGYRSDISAALARKYGESQHGYGVQSAAAVFEIWASTETGSWTILMTRPDGTSCLMASGQGWQDVPPTPPVTGSAS